MNMNQTDNHYDIRFIENKIHITQKYRISNLYKKYPYSVIISSYENLCIDSINDLIKELINDKNNTQEDMSSINKKTYHIHSICHDEGRIYGYDLISPWFEKSNLVKLNKSCYKLIINGCDVDYDYYITNNNLLYLLNKILEYSNNI